MSHPIMRHAGRIVFWLCQHRWKDSNVEWSESGDTFFAKIPQELRFIDPPTAKATPLFREYNDTWQKTGHHGWESAESAKAVMHLLAEYNPGHRFRVVRLEIELRLIPVAEAICIESPGE